MKPLKATYKVEKSTMSVKQSIKLILIVITYPHKLNVYAQHKYNHYAYTHSHNNT